MVVLGRWDVLCSRHINVPSCKLALNVAWSLTSRKALFNHISVTSPGGGGACLVSVVTCSGVWTLLATYAAAATPEALVNPMP